MSFATILCLLWLLIRLAVLSQTGIPQPKYHDEFSYLLGADTFAHGRLTNPSPPLSKFFESPHVMVRPTYASKYPPGQALFLAAGEFLLGSPFYGVLLGNLLMLFATSLMLFSWVSARWALRVSILLALYLCPSMYWTDSYWGGSVAVAGGAIVLLAVGMSRGPHKVLVGSCLAIGALLLFWTRPYEGGVFALAALALFWKRLWQCTSRSSVTVTAGILIAGLGFTGALNYSVTGNALELPYLLHSKQYDTTPVFWFQPMRPAPHYSSERLAAVHGPDGFEARLYIQLRSNTNFVQAFFKSFLQAVKVLDLRLEFALALTLLIPMAWHDWRYRYAFIISVACAIALSLETFHMEHYDAPAWAAFLLMIAVWGERADEKERKMSNRHGRQPAGLAFLVLVIPTSLLFILYTSEALKAESRTQRAVAQVNVDSENWGQQRFNLIQQLSSQNHQSLVIVHYPSPDWKVDDEWVYNSANIDQQKVVFAHDFGEQEDKLLLRHYPNRVAYLLTFNPVTGEDKIVPYTSNTAGIKPIPGTADGAGMVLPNHSTH